MKLIKTMSILEDGKQTRVTIPNFIIDVFNITNKDMFNWYIEKKGNRINLIGKLSKERYRLNYYKNKSKIKKFLTRIKPKEFINLK